MKSWDILGHFGTLWHILVHCNHSENVLFVNLENIDILPSINYHTSKKRTVLCKDGPFCMES